MTVSQLFSIFLAISELSAEKVLYHFEDDTVILPCKQLQNDQIVWQGPENYSTYGYGDIINPKFSKSNRLAIIHVNGSHQYNLQIRHFSSEDEGHYKCIRGKDGEEFFTLKIGTMASNLTILEEDSQHIVYGYLNLLLELSCTVIHGVPNGKLVWMVNNKTLEEDASSLLVYSFIPKQEDHLKNYTCATKSNLVQYVMERTVRLFVYMPPIVSISLNKTMGIPEGADLKLFCNYSSNHEVKELKWEKRFLHESPLDERSQYLNIKSINRQHAGKYRCTVTNLAGSASDIVTIEVYYPPTVYVTFEDRGSYKRFNCLANGVPDQYIFTQWEHRSDYSEIIRYLPDNGSGKLILPHIPGETDRHHDRGFYICHASNNVSLNGSNYFIPGEFFLKAQGKSYFVTSNKNTQYGIKGQQGTLTYDFVSFPDIENISVIVNDMLRYENYSIKTMKVMDRVYNKTVLVNGSRLLLTVSVKADRDVWSYTIILFNKFGSAAFTIDLRQLRAPQNLKAVALDTQIIVKWTGNHNNGLQETFFVEYRKHFESLWSQVSAENKSTAILNGLQPGAVYFLRVFSKTAAGESSRSDIIIVKTEKQHSKVKVFTVELAMILGVIFSMIVICWCGNKALTYKQRSSRIQNIRGTLSRRNDETIMRPAHYDEIDSMYYNSINATISHQASRNNVQDSTRQPLNVSLGDWQANNISNRNVLCTVHQLKSSQENNSLRSSSDESYLVPCRNYIELDNVKITENEHQDTSNEETAINLDKSSISSNNSETNIKVIQRYETLNVSDINEHCYKKYNETEESPNE